jgi:hypothetical protein
MKKFIYGVMSLTPALSLAAIGTTGTIVADIYALVKGIIPIIFAIAIIYFFWGLVVFLRGAGDPKVQEAGRNQMIWGIVAIAVMLSIYGIVGWLQTTLGVGTTTTVTLPQLP